MSKSLWHSELTKLGQIEVRIKSDVTKSQYKGKPPYVILEIDGTERLYTVENRDCERSLQGLKGRAVMLEASGSREEAEIRIETLDGAHEETQPRRRITEAGTWGTGTQAPETFAEQQAREAKTFVEATRYCAKMGVLVSICYTQARLIFKAEDFPSLSEYELEDLRLRLANTLAIETKANIPVASLPAQWPESKPLESELETDEEGAGF